MVRVFALVFACLLTIPAFADPASALGSVLGDLRSLEAEMLTNQQRIDALQDELERLQALSQESDGEVVHLQALLDAHAVRVQQLGERYAEALATVARQNQELAQARTWAWVWGGSTAVAVVVVVLQAWGGGR